MSDKVDVFICGSGSAGLTAATWLAKYGIRCKIVDSRSGPLEVGHADGIQTRTTEIFESFGLEDALLREGQHNVECAFWMPDVKTGGIQRKRCLPASSRDLSHLPRLILSQTRTHGILLDAMKKWNGQEVDYGQRVTDVKVDEQKAKDQSSYPVTITIEKEGKQEIFEAKYALGCDGAHSTVRKSLGYTMVGDSSDKVWGVMDFIPRTAFPDLRKIAVIKSDVGSVLNIPREGGFVNRFYMELPPGTVAKEVKVEDLQAATRRIFSPSYEIEFATTIWWSAYTVGQRVADNFTKSHRVFLTGDACHTHSPTAGQGMNVSLQDGYNLGWKLASILKGQTSPEVLKTYVIERQMVAQDLIDWDRNWVKSIASMKKDEGGAVDANGNVDFSEIWLKAEVFTAALTIVYQESPLTRPKGSTQSLAENLKIGMRFPTAPVVRFCDGLETQLVRALPSDGRWRIVVFPGDIRETVALRKLNQLGENLFSTLGPIHKYTAPGADIDSFIEVLVVLQGDRTSMTLEQVPTDFLPLTGQWSVRDPHKIFFDDESYHSGHGHAYEAFGIDPEKGALAIVRPDNYVSMILDVEDHNSVNDFFGAFAYAQASNGLSNGQYNGYHNGIANGVHNDTPNGVRNGIQSETANGVVNGVH